MDFDYQEFLKSALDECGAFKTGHFELSSGRHSAQYVQCAQFCKHPHLNIWAASKISKLIKSKPDVVVSPAIGGMLIGYEVANQLTTPFLFVEREKGAGPMKLRRDFEIKPGSNVLIVEDVVTTGKSVFEVSKIVEENNANVVSIACIIDRTNGALDFGREFVSLLSIDSLSYEPNSCPLCASGSQPYKPGSRFS